MTGHQDAGGDAAWPQRCLTDGQLVITRGRDARPRGSTAEVLRGVGLMWRELTRRQKWWTWIGVLILATLIGAPFRLISEDASGVVSACVLGAFGVLLLLAGYQAGMPVVPRPPSPEEVLARTDSAEARVAGAASRAWMETMREPSWHSPYLATSRATFDGQAEVDEIIDMALRIHGARMSLGPRPAGSAASLWDRQHLTLERAADRLGRRADALIRYRDQAARLSGELRNLADLERVAATTAQIDGLAVEVAHGQGPTDGGLADMAHEVAAIRATVTELLDEMIRTSELVTEPSADPLEPDAGRP